jgi:hypothetical protein
MNGSSVSYFHLFIPFTKYLHVNQIQLNISLTVYANEAELSAEEQLLV